MILDTNQPKMTRIFIVSLFLFMQANCSQATTDSVSGVAPPVEAGPAQFAALLTTTLDPEIRGARVEIAIRQEDGALKSIDLAASEKRFSNVKADGEVTHKNGRMVWQIPKGGGTLSYATTLNTQRAAGYDARITGDWAVLRWEDLIPPSRNRLRKGTTGRTTLKVNAPKGWSVESTYGSLTNKTAEITDVSQNFSKPAGWLIAGKLGIRRDEISGRNIVVAAPLGSGYPRVPTLAFLRWVLPELTAAFPQLGERVLVVSGDNSMWRGALSGPASLYLHPTRPVISENSTSPLVHELVHVATRWHAAPGDDWIVEGIAEFYAIELLRRSDGISQQRYDRALLSLSDWAQEERASLTDPSKGADTAYAALLFAKLHRELLAKDPAGLDAVVQKLRAGDGGRFEVSTELLRAEVNERLGGPSRVLQDALSHRP